MWSSAWPSVSDFDIFSPSGLSANRSLCRKPWNCRGLRRAHDAFKKVVKKVRE
jgi:hypothetical protein